LRYAAMPTDIRRRDDRVLKREYATWCRVLADNVTEKLREKNRLGGARTVRVKISVSSDTAIMLRFIATELELQHAQSASRLDHTALWRIRRAGRRWFRSRDYGAMRRQLLRELGELL